MPNESPLIMLVDDDFDYLEINKFHLESKGYRVVCFSDPAEALKEICAEKPDLIITDLMMQHINSGFSFSKEIKSDPRFKDIPVIIITAIGSKRGFDFAPRTSEELATMNADAYFEKPVVPEVLIAKIIELLEG